MITRLYHLRFLLVFYAILTPLHMLLISLRKKMLGHY